MRRPATKSWQREDTERDQGGDETNSPEAAPDAITPPVIEDVKDARHEPEIPPLQITPRRKQGGGIISLIIIALLGMIIGFAAVMLI